MEGVRGATEVMSLCGTSPADPRKERTSGTVGQPPGREEHGEFTGVWLAPTLLLFVAGIGGEEGSPLGLQSCPARSHGHAGRGEDAGWVASGHGRRAVSTCCSGHV